MWGAFIWISGSFLSFICNFFYFRLVGPFLLLWTFHLPSAQLRRMNEKEAIGEGWKRGERSRKRRGRNKNGEKIPSDSAKAPDNGHVFNPHSSLTSLQLRLHSLSTWAFNTTTDISYVSFFFSLKNETTTSKVFQTRKYTYLLTKYNMMQFM